MQMNSQKALSLAPLEKRNLFPYPQLNRFFLTTAKESAVVGRELEIQPEYTLLLAAVCMHHHGHAATAKSAEIKSKTNLLFRFRTGLEKRVTDKRSSSESAATYRESVAVVAL